jgi:hypothetical protein
MFKDSNYLIKIINIIKVIIWTKVEIILINIKKIIFNKITQICQFILINNMK